jgi:hypothetical protein
MRDVGALAERYRWFVEHEVAGSSPTYEEWGLGVAADDDLLARLAGLPTGKQQPHLLFASARFCGVPLEPYAVFGPWAIEHWDEVADVILSRATQTNEAARCGALLPLLSAIDGPIALIEVGASAGLCLIPDRYGYRFVHASGQTDLLPDLSSPVTIHCRISGAAVPRKLPDIVWRAGIDLNPLDAANPDDARWLELLIWPEHTERRERLKAALALVVADPVRIVAGDLVERLPGLAAEAPSDATLVVMHTAVLNYLSPDHRLRAIDVIRGTGARWISQEGIAVVDDIRTRLPADLGSPPRYVIALDGEPVALTGFHGGSYAALQSQ